jgi:hypothetical protein
MATTAAQMAAYLYPEEEDPEGAFSWWLSPCGGTDLVPEDIKKAFDIMSTVANSGSSFKPPKKFKKGSQKKGNDANPHQTDRAKPRPLNTPSNGVTKKKKQCSIKPGSSTIRSGAAKNTLLKQSCVAGATQKQVMVITSIAYAANAQATQVKATCLEKNSQACYHYSSAIRQNPSWSTLTCDDSAATVTHRLNAKATNAWTAQHRKIDWQAKKYRKQQFCDRDEYPPAYLLYPAHPAFSQAGLNSQGQSVRLLPDTENRSAGQMWRGVCFKPSMEDLSHAEFERKVRAAVNPSYARKAGVDQTFVAATVTTRPEFTIAKWEHKAPPAPDGLKENPCWPSGIAKDDPGFVLLDFDPYYQGMKPPYDYRKPYVKGSNGS